MSNVLSEEKRQQILALGRLGWSLRHIQRATGVRRETAAAYLREGGVDVGPRGRRKVMASGEAPTEATLNAEPAKPAIEVTTDFGGENSPSRADVIGWAESRPASEVANNVETPAKPAIEVTADFDGARTESEASASVVKPNSAAEAAYCEGDGDQKEPASRGTDNPVQGTRKELDSRPGPTSSPTLSTCEEFREAIELGLSRGRNAMAIWQDLVSYNGFKGGYQSVKRFARKLRGAHVREACGIITTGPGEESQVDYGQGPMVRDSKTGKYRRTRLFVMTLGYSRKSVRLITFRSSTQTWAQLHEQAFRRLGGATKIVVLDNLREGVLTPDIYDPALNPVYRDLLTHYGAVAMPCRIKDPDRKAYVSYCTLLLFSNGEKLAAWILGPHDL